MREIILEFLKRFKNTDFGNLSGYQIDILVESFNSERNSDFFLCEKDYNFFVDADAYFYIDDKKGVLNLLFSAYDKRGEVITSLSENYEYIDWFYLQDLSDKKLEVIANDWCISIENWKARALTKYKELYGEQK